MFKNSFSEKPLNWLKQNRRNDHWMVLYQLCVFRVNWKSKMATTTGTYFNIGLYGKCWKICFSEITDQIKTKLYMNDHCLVLYQVCIFLADRKSKMAYLYFDLGLINFLQSCKHVFTVSFVVHQVSDYRLLRASSLVFWST